jgi:hypothetical protein
MHLSNSRRSSPAVYSTTSIPACQIRRPGRPSLRGTEHRPISPPSRTSYTDVCPRGALGAPSSSSLRTALASCTTAHPVRRWPRTGRAVLLRRQPRRRLRRARILRCGCCVMRLVARTSCLSRRWSRLIWTRRGWTTRRSSSRRYRKHISFFSCLTLFFLTLAIVIVVIESLCTFSLLYLSWVFSCFCVYSLSSPTSRALFLFVALGVVCAISSNYSSCIPYEWAVLCHFA